jgi:hypothetical protein
MERTRVWRQIDLFYVPYRYFFRCCKTNGGRPCETPRLGAARSVHGHCLPAGGAHADTGAAGAYCGCCCADRPSRSTYGHACAPDRHGDGNLLIAGTTTSFGAQGMDAYLLKVDRDGNELWSKTYGGPLDEMVGAVGQLPDGSYILGGNIVDPNDLIADPGAAGYGGFAGRSNLYLLKVDGDGNELWSRAYDSEDNVLAVSAALMPDGGLLALAAKVRMGEHAQYGYGIMNRMVGDQRAVGHGGGAPGICSLMNIYLDLGYTTIMLTNGDEDCMAADEIIKAALLP